MSIFNDQGMMIFPTPMSRELRESKNVLVAKLCFCPNAHKLISNRVHFNKFPGVLLKVTQGDSEGLLALSPVFGDKSRITIDIELTSDDLISMRCPECDAALPVYSACSCGGDLLALFTSEPGNFSDCIGVCNRVDCYNAEFTTQDELLSGTLSGETGR